jgi:hypothetical protein
MHNLEHLLLILSQRIRQETGNNDLADAALQTGLMITSPPVPWRSPWRIAVAKCVTNPVGERLHYLIFDSPPTLERSNPADTPQSHCAPRLRSGTRCTEDAQVAAQRSVLRPHRRARRNDDAGLDQGVTCDRSNGLEFMECGPVEMRCPEGARLLSDS